MMRAVEDLTKELARSRIEQRTLEDIHDRKMNQAKDREARLSATIAYLQAKVDLYLKQHKMATGTGTQCSLLHETCTLTVFVSY